MIKKKCPYCPKEIEGYTLKQTEYMLKQHMLARHQDKIYFPIQKKEIKRKEATKN